MRSSVRLGDLVAEFGPADTSALAFLPLEDQVRDTPVVVGDSVAVPSLRTGGFVRDQVEAFNVLRSVSGFALLDLEGADLSGLDLRGANFAGAILSHADLQRMAAAGARAFLVGEAFMRAEDPGTRLADLFA